MMNLSSLKNNRGMTLVELTVAMAITGILLAGMVSASLFVQKFIGNWQKKDVTAEELAFVVKELTPQIANARIVSIFNDSIRLVDNKRLITSYSWSKGLFRKGNRNLLRTGTKIDRLTISRLALPYNLENNTLNKPDQNRTTGLFELFVKVTSKQGVSDSLKVMVRNEYEYHKFSN
jgi:prepilin-type N-terminal cleavage/methylation domain-containing protein